jgi:protein-tyrosine phosphatase
LIDLHCHILPDIDDGPANINGSIKIAETACKEGVRCIFATPHHGNGVYEVYLKQIEDYCGLLNEALRQKKIHLFVYSGAEVHIHSSILNDLAAGNVITLGNMGMAVLLELPEVYILDGIEMIFKQMVNSGILPIVAHPERNPLILKQPFHLERFIYAGARMQVTAGSVVGDYGPLSQNCVIDMLKKDQVHFLGSDMHPGRKYRMADFKKKVSKLTTAEKLYWITEGACLDLVFTEKMRQNCN